MSHPILYNKNIKNRVNLKKSFLLSTLIHVFLIFGVSFIFIYKQPLFDSSPVVNIKLANADVDQDPDFLPQVNNLINGNGTESSKFIETIEPGFRCSVNNFFFDSKYFFRVL